MAEMNFQAIESNRLHEGGRLTVVEVPPALEAPSPERAVLACDRCRSLMEAGIGKHNPATLRFLAETVWSEVLPAQLVAVRLLRSLAASGEAWAQEANDSLWLAEEAAELV